MERASGVRGYTSAEEARAKARDDALRNELASSDNHYLVRGLPRVRKPSVVDAFEIDASSVKPENIRFFRKQMKNMISIALGDLPEVRCVPSRATYQLQAWLEEREATVYPRMSGYRKPRPEAPGMKMPVRLPEQLRGAPPPRRVGPVGSP